uniref:Bromo domain-containing protein n=1 Tax=Heterorhabditis bacteriophora TaxID=37862 RepID=A0A1I7XIL3_HETBA
MLVSIESSVEIGIVVILRRDLVFFSASMFCMKRGIVDNMRLSCRPYRFDFENNEDEERAIAEAIAREEELMRIEEENKANDGLARTDLGGRDGLCYICLFLMKIIRITQFRVLYHFFRSTMNICHLFIIYYNNSDLYNSLYFFNILKPRMRVDVEKFRSRRMFANQREMILAEHVDRLRKEINKRRTRLENKAEEQCGLLTPWRKARGRPNRVPKRIYSPETHRPRRVVNPAEISLGGDSVDWTKSELPEEPTQTSNLTNEDELIEDTTPPPLKRKKFESTMEPAEEAFTVTDWQPKRKGPALSTPNQDKEQLNRVKVDDSSADELSSLRSESRSRRGRPPHKRENELDQLDRNHDDSEAASERPPPEGMDPLALHCVCQTLYNPRKSGLSNFMWGVISVFVGSTEDVSMSVKEVQNEWMVGHAVIVYEIQREHAKNKSYIALARLLMMILILIIGVLHEGLLISIAAEAMAEYMCPNCQEAHTAQGYESNASNSSSVHPALSRADYPLVWRLLDTISEHRMAWPFRQPVDIKEFPNYTEVIKNPIDLSAIQKKIEHLEYHQLKDFTRDMTQMFENARLFNPKVCFTSAQISQLHKRRQSFSNMVTIL